MESSFIRMAKERPSSSKQDKCTAHRIFFNEDGVQHHEFTSAGQTVNMEYYVGRTESHEQQFFFK